MSQLEAITRERHHGALIRARARARASCFGGKRQPRERLHLKKRYACRNRISEIEYRGMLRTDQAHIEGAFKKFMKHFFSVHKVDSDKFKDEFLNLLPQIEDDIKTIREMPITVNETMSAIEKTPGPDG